MNFRNSVISISLASLLVGCGGDTDSVKNAINGPDIKGSTMLKSELIYNQVVASKTKESVLPYIMGKFGGAKPTEQNSKDIETAVANAKAAHPDKKPAAVTAAVINKVIAIASSNPSGIKDITVTAQDIVDADVPSLAKLTITESFSKSNDDEIQRQNNLGWIDAKDMELMSITAKNGKIVGGSKYHNGLTVIDVASKNSVFSPVSIISDHGHHIDSASGASENRLEGVVLNSDASFVYVNIPHKKYKPDTADLETVGLYKAKIESDGSIKTTESPLPVGTGKRLMIDESVSVRLNKIVKRFAVANDDSKVVVLDSEDNLFIYDGNLANKSAELETDGIEAVAISGDTVFASIENNITKMSTGDLSIAGQIEIGFEAKGIVVNSDGTKLVAFDDKTKIAVVNLADNSIKSGSILYAADMVSVSDDFTKAALSGEDEDTILVVNLTVPGFSIQGKYDATSEHVAFLGNDKLVIGKGSGLAVLDVTTTTENINLATKIELAKEGLHNKAINNGNYFNTVVKDMKLPTSYENINIAWTSNLPIGNLNPADGNVTRTDSDASGELTATLLGAFRGQEVTGNKAFDLTVKKIVPTTDVTSSLDLTDDFRGGYMSAGVNGKVASLNKEGDEGGIYILDSDATTLSFYVGDIATGYHKFGGKEDGIAVSYTKENQVVAVTTLGNIYRYTIGGMNNITESQKISQAEGISTKSAVFNSLRTKLAVLVSDESDNYTTKIYDIAGDGTVTHNSDIAMEKLVYNGEIAINDDASVIYTRSDGDVVNAQDGTTHTSHVIGERIRGIYYVNDTLYATDSTGKLTAFAGGDLSSNTKTDTGHNGRAYMIKEVGDELFIFLYAKNTTDGGVSIVNKATLEELRFIPAKTAYRGTVSANGKGVYFFSYTKPRKLNYTRLP